MGPAPKGQASKVYLKLEIGDQNEAAKQEKGYELAQNFLKSVGSQVSYMLIGYANEYRSNQLFLGDDLNLNSPTAPQSPIP